MNECERCRTYEAIIERTRLTALDLAEMVKKLRGYVRHKKGCTVNPGGPIMTALGDPEKRPCSCGLDEIMGGDNAK